MLEGNPKLVLALNNKLKSDKDPLNLLKYVHTICDIACKSTSNKKIADKHINLFKNKLKTYCKDKNMQGGSAATIEWNGVTDHSYSTTASTADVLDVDTDIIARPAITPALAASLNQTGGDKREDYLTVLKKEVSSCCPKLDKAMDRAVKEFLAKEVIKSMRCLLNASVEKNRLLKMR